VRADAGGEAGVILSSAMSLVQGLFPANSDYTITLADGTTVEGPLNGYQVCPVSFLASENANDSFFSMCQVSKGGKQVFPLADAVLHSRIR
jgi:hypothetical protein